MYGDGLSEFLTSTDRAKKNKEKRNEKKKKKESGACNIFLANLFRGC